MSNHTAVPPAGEGQPAPAISVGPRARKRIAVKLDKSDTIVEGPHKGKRPSELAIELADEHRRTAELAQAKIIKDLNERAAELVRLRAKVRERSAAFDRAVALAVSSKPESPDWYDHPGPVPRSRVVSSVSGEKLSTMKLHRMMERYRKVVAAKPRRASRT